MKRHMLVVTTTLISTVLAFAQTTPTTGTTGTTTTTPSMSATTTTPMSQYGVAVAPPTQPVMMSSTGMSTTSMVGTTTGSLQMSSTDATMLSNQIAVLTNEVRALRGDVISARLQMQGQQLASRMNQLQANEMQFRQNLAQNPNLPGAQQQAAQLQTEAMLLRNDIASFNRELSLVPAQQRPYIASQLNTFDIAYWDPAQNRFVDYRTQFGQTATTSYQPAYAANPWLQNWQTNYQATLSDIGTNSQMIAANRWWTGSGMQVAGTTEMYPMGTQPSGVMYIPPQNIPGVMPSTATPTTTPMTPMP